MNRAERAVRLLPAPLKATAKSARHAVDPVAMSLYRRRTGNQEAIPPSAVRARTGSASIPAWVEGGAHHADDLEAALSVVGHSFSDFEAILDFGCGSGRVLRHVMGRGGPETRYAGSDVDAEAVAWADTNLPEAIWRVNPYRPPLPFEEGEFDLVYSISIYTHFSEDLQLAWIAEMARVLRPGGIALLSVHGCHAFAECTSGRLVSNSPSCARRVMSHHSLAEERFVYEPYEIGAWNQHDFPGIDDTFGMAFHSRAYLEERWTEDFELLEVLPTRIGGWQDLPVLRRR
jgi:SAM-dependent methyltransferase